MTLTDCTGKAFNCLRGFVSFVELWAGTEMDMGWVHPWVGSGRIGSNFFWQMSWVGFNATVMGCVQRLREVRTTFKIGFYTENVSNKNLTEIRA